MDKFFIFSIIVAVLAVIGLVAYVKMPKTVVKNAGIGSKGTEVVNEDRQVVGFVAWVFAGVAVVLFLLSTFVIIQQQHVGEEVVAGKPVGTLGVGYHWKNPVATVKRYDGQLQPEKYSTDTGDQGGPFSVLLSGGSTAYVNLTYQWKLSTDIDSIYRNYPSGNTGQLNDNVVKRDVQQALNIAYGNYNPYAGIEAQQTTLTALSKGEAPPAIQPSLTYQQYADQILPQLQAKLAPEGIDFVSLVISTISFDKGTQGRIDELNQQIIDTQKKIQAVIGAQAQANANKLLTANPPTLAQLQQECLTNTNVNPSAYAGITFWNCFGAPSATPMVMAGK